MEFNESTMSKMANVWGNQICQHDYIQQLFADRIGGSQFGLKEEIYKFEKIKRAKKEALHRQILTWN